MAPGSDIAAGRLAAADLVGNFADLHPPLSPAQAVVEAERCYFCHDAPCVQACPTAIDVPNFIRGIATGNLRGAAEAILTANIFGGLCARVCPTEILCEQACVRMAQEERPIAIGALQRHATDWAIDRGAQPYAREAPTGRRIAVVGAGPAGLACAHGLARRGHEVVVHEARPKPGGLSEYGIAAYKVPDDFVQAEIAYLLSIGGIELRHGVALGAGLGLGALRRAYDAVFLGLGQGGLRALGLGGESLAGVQAATAFIAALRQAPDKGRIAIGRRVVVIGGGNTAVDAAVQARRLGAEDVTIVYRRGPAEMTATAEEQRFAQLNGVRLRHWLTPVRLLASGAAVCGAEFARTHLRQGRLVETGGRETLPADMVLRATGQVFVPEALIEEGALPLDVADGRIAVDAEGRTSLPGVWAGGDCVAGLDLSVRAVADGRRAADAIHRFLAG